MPSLPPPSVTPTIEEKLAKLCVRPHLSSDVLPRFVLTMLECALHSFLCSFAACVMEIIEKYRRGELEPWPDEPEDQLQPRGSNDKPHSAPAAPQRSAGARHGQMAADTVPVAGHETCEAAVATCLGRLISPPALARRRIHHRQIVQAQPPAGCAHSPLFRNEASKIFRAGCGLRENCV